MKNEHQDIEIWIKESIACIAEPEENARRAAQQRLDRLTKPKGSLGVLEELVVRLAAMTGQERPDVTPACLLLFAADHGVTGEGVSAYPSEVTAQMVQNFIQGGAAVNVLARWNGLRLRVIDMGVLRDIRHPRLEVVKVRRGTENMTLQPAMSRGEAVRSVALGIKAAQEEAARGSRCLCLGEMGIGNSTAGSACLSALSGLPAEETVGHGTGLDETGWRRKVEAVTRALNMNRPDPDDPLDVLHKVGGLEIAALAGAILGAAASRMPVILDGFITGAAALAAAVMAPGVVHYCIAAHRSVEPGHAAILSRLGLKPLLDLRMRLGEGSGAALAFPLVHAACRLMDEMATFESAGVSGEIEGI